MVLKLNSIRQIHYELISICHSTCRIFEMKTIRHIHNDFLTYRCRSLRIIGNYNQSSFGLRNSWIRIYTNWCNINLSSIHGKLWLDLINRYSKGIRKELLAGIVQFILFLLFKFFPVSFVHTSVIKINGCSNK